MTFQAKSVTWNETSLAENLSSSAGSKTAPLETPDNTVSTEVEGVTATHSTTQFVDDHVMVMKDESHITHVDYSITKLNNTQNSIASVTEFLAKPIVLTSGTFNLSDTFSVFNTLPMPYAALQASTAAIWRQKLAGFFGIRMDMRFRLVVNANKFQQGRYIMGWTGTGGNTQVTSNLKAYNFLYSHNATLVQRTTVPHVEIDLSTQSVAELLVPYASVAAYYPLNAILSSTDRLGLGFITIYPYDALQAPTGSTTCGYTLYVSFENVQLYGAASAQGGLSKREVVNKNNGPISGLAGAISRGFKEFSNIPLIGEYAKGVSWISDRISNTAAIFGFSKPTAGDCVPKMMITNAPSHSTVDGESDARALSYLNQPGVVPLKGLSGTDYDEMDFSYIKSKYAWFRTFTWTVLNNVDDVLTDIDVAPSTGQLTSVVDGYDNISYTPIAFLFSQFNFWRGSLKFRFKIVKTEYHSGRLQFAFYPTDTDSYISDAAYVNRVIIDVREHSEVEIVVPFIHHSPWKKRDEDPTGRLIVTVVDPLVAPSSVSPSINILTEMSGGEDFEVAVPAEFAYTPTVFVPQGLDGPRREENIYSSVIGDSVINSDAHLMSGLTIGDKVSSVRALIKRFSPILPTAGNIKMNGRAIFIFPDVVLFHKGTTALPGTDNFTADLLSIWASCYTFMSGGIRYRDVLDYGTTNVGLPGLHTSIQASLISNFLEKDTFVSDFSIDFPINQHRVLQDTSSNNTLTVEFPQYTTTFSRSICDCILIQGTTSSSATSYNSGSTSQVCLMISTPSSLTITPVGTSRFHHLFRSGSDDLNLSGFISIPPMRSIEGISTTLFV